MSEERPERSELIRSTVITTILTVIPFALAIAFWAWSSPDVINTSPVGMIRAINQYLLYAIEIILMTWTFAFLFVTVLNLRLGLTGRRGGWSEVIACLIAIGLATVGMFGLGVMGMTVILSLGFIGYVYLLQE